MSYLLNYYRKIRSETQNYFRNKRNIKLRKRIKNVTPSIICDNCTAGVIYHDLGLKFMSPTINLYMYPDDYLKFISNIKYYLSCDIVESNEKGNDEGEDFPIGIIDDIKVYFMHYRSFDEAKLKWVERSKRIDYDNLFVIMNKKSSACKKEHIERFDLLPIKNKIIFVNKNMPNIKSAVYLKGYENQDGIGNIMLYKQPSFFAKRKLEDFDYVSWLNGEIES